MEKMPGVPFLHLEQRDASLVILSHRGIRSRMVPNFFLSKSPSNPAIYICLPCWRNWETVWNRSSKNCPSFIKMTYAFEISGLERVLDKVVNEKHGILCWSWVESMVVEIS